MITTPGEAYDAGLRAAAAAGVPPLTKQQATTVALLLAPNLQPQQPRAA